MHTNYKRFFYAAVALFMLGMTANIYAATAAAPAVKQLEDATDSFIISVTSNQPTPIEGSYLIMSDDNSKFVAMNQEAPFELQVPVNTINAVFHVSSASTDEIKVDLYLVPKSDPNKKKLLTSGSGHSVIVSNIVSKRKKNVYSIVGGP